jgi:uncharacterized protein involved in exopolysaccharide biosynthesis
MKLFNFDPNIKIIENDEINLINLLKVIWGGRWFIILTTVVGSLLVLAYTYTLTPLYKSEISLYPVLSSSKPAGLSQLQGLASSFGYDLGTTESNFNIPDVVNSKRIKLAIINHDWYFSDIQDTMSLLEYWHKDDKPGIISRIFGEQEKNPELKRLKWENQALQKINDRITVSESKKTGLITVSVLSEEPRLSKEIVAFIADALIKYINQVQLKQASENRQFIEERIKETEAQLNESEETLKRFREDNRSIKDSPELQLELERLMRDVEVNQQVYITLKQQYEIARIEEVKEAPIVNVLDEGREAVEKDWPKRKLTLVFLIFLIVIFTIIATFIIYKVRQLKN